MKGRCPLQIVVAFVKFVDTITAHEAAAQRW